MREPYTQLYVHLVWSTWERSAVLTGELKSRVYACIQSECKKLKVDAIAIGGTEDHTHLFGRIPTTISIATLAKQVKGASSHLANQEIRDGTLFRWQEGYGAFTVSKSLKETVRMYVLGQEEHHRDGTTDEDLETIWSEEDDPDAW